MWDVQELMDYWSEFPPAHIVLGAQYLKRSARSNKQSQSRELKGAALSLGGAVKRISDLPEYLRKK